MRRAKNIATIVAASLFTFGASPLLADSAKDAEALSALRAIIQDPETPVAPVLLTYGFNESHYLVDGLNGNEQRALRDRLYEYHVKLPSGIASALRIKVPRRRSR
ncbi:MAG: hypothetical protein ACPGGK_07280 [Pikeienuella sp.]